MSNSGTDSRGERAGVLLALELTRKQPAGPCPDEEQIAAWVDGALEQRRGEEVKSHVAHCEHCFAVWTGLLDAEPVPAEKPGKTQRTSTGGSWLTSWRGLLTGGGLATGLAAVLAVMVFVPMTDDAQLRSGLESGYATFADAYAPSDLVQRWPWSGPLATRSGTGSPDDPVARVADLAFRAGVMQGIGELASESEFWREVLRSAGPQPVPCESAQVPDGCLEIAETMSALGRWSALTYLACESSGDAGAAMPARLDVAFWDQQRAMLQRLDASVSITLPDSAYARLLRQWTARPVESAGARGLVCERITTLLTLGLAG